MAFLVPPPLTGSPRSPEVSTSFLCPDRISHSYARVHRARRAPQIWASAPQQSTPVQAPRPLQWATPAEKLYSALSLRFETSEGSQQYARAFADIVASECTWDTPLFRAIGISEMMATLDSFASFFLQPTVQFTNVEPDEKNENVVCIEWLISFTYPLPWRPRLTISGTTLLTCILETSVDSNPKITHIVDKWDVPAYNILYQAIPRLSDILALYPAPHAETDSGTRRLLARKDGYSIVRVAARPVIRCQVKLPSEDQLYVWAVPALPEGLFVGGLRRQEEYATVSPVSVRRVSGDDFEWEIPVPGNMLGNSTVHPPPYTWPCAQSVVSRPRCFAVQRCRGYALTEVFEKRVESLESKLQRDGYLQPGVSVDRAHVWSRSYDAKVGFNTKGQLAIAAYGTTYGIPPRLNELAIELPDDVNHEK